MKKIKAKTALRTVYYCPICGWESFNDDDYEASCGQTGCSGKLTKIRKEKYTV